MVGGDVQGRNKAGDGSGVEKQMEGECMQWVDDWKDGINES